MGGGTIHPNPNIRGAFLGLTLSHKKEDLIRSVMEGVAFDLRMVLDEFKNMGVDANEIRIVGGGSESKLWRQIFSDIYNTKIIVTNIGQETAALGAAAVAAVGTGLWKDFSVIDEITEVLDINTPDKKNSKKYEKMLDVYKFIAEKISDIGEKMASY
jgi:sugar (pentulose or hexulose) kinase